MKNFDSSICPCCGSSEFRVIRTVKRKLGGLLISYELHSCKNCGFVAAKGPHDKNLMESIFDNAFHNSSQQWGPVLDRGITKSALRYPIIRNSYKRVQLMKKFNVQGPLLDVGSARGHFLRIASESIETCTGVDLNPEVIAFSKKMGVHTIAADFLDCSFEEQSFGCLTFWDVISGFPDPQKVVHRTSELLRSGGHLIMTIPDPESVAARILGDYWPLMIPPINLSFFSLSAISLLLENNGFELLYSKKLSKRVSFDFLIQKLQKMVSSNLVSEKRINLAPRVSIPVNMWDIITIVARKS